jgi:hypothetical protein
MTRYSRPEKKEIIRLVEKFEPLLKQTLTGLDAPRSTFYNWYWRYVEGDYNELTAEQPYLQPCARTVDGGVPNLLHEGHG